MDSLITMKIKKLNDSTQLISFEGTFDKAGHSEIRDELDKAVTEFSQKTLAFNFSKLSYINSEGIGYLMEVHTHLIQNDKKLVIVGANDNVKDVLNTIGIAEIIPIYEKLDDLDKK